MNRPQFTLICSSMSSVPRAWVRATRCCAIAHALVEAGHSVLCAPAFALVQELLAAKRDLDLPRALRKLDLFEVILLDKC